MAVSPELRSAINRRAGLKSKCPGLDLTDLETEIAEIRIRDLVTAKIAEFPKLLADPARRERLAALLSDGAATDD